VLRSPNHETIPVSAAVTATNLGDAAPLARILKVTSDELENVRVTAIPQRTDRGSDAHRPRRRIGQPQPTPAKSRTVWGGGGSEVDEVRKHHQLTGDGVPAPSPEVLSGGPLEPFRNLRPLLFNLYVTVPRLHPNALFRTDFVL
jgi:hypothetical protein